MGTGRRGVVVPGSFTSSLGYKRSVHTSRSPDSPCQGFRVVPLGVLDIDTQFPELLDGRGDVSDGCGSHRTAGQPGFEDAERKGLSVAGIEDTVEHRQVVADVPSRGASIVAIS